AVLSRAAVVVYQVVPGHAAQPGEKGALGRVIGPEHLKDLDKDLLGQILRVARPSAEPIAQVVNLARVALEQLLPGRVFAREAPSYEFRVAFHSGHSPLLIQRTHLARPCSGPGVTRERGGHCTKRTSRESKVKSRRGEPLTLGS